MTPSVKALVTPSVLVWAREEAGFSLDQVAQKLQVDVAKISTWEQGEDQPSVSQLRKLANIYKRAIGIFYLPVAPERTPKLHDYRRIVAEHGISESPQLRFEIRRATNRRETALDLYGELEESAPLINNEIHIGEDPENVADSIRSWLKLTYAEQISWRDPYKAFNWWRAAIESQGILVFQVSGVAVTEMRGFSIHDRPMPIIAVNVKDHPRGRIFTMIHELAHILLHEGGICTLHENRLRTQHDQKIEIFCNTIAGATIVPKKYLEIENLVALHSTSPIWTDDELRSIANRYQASRETILRRLLISGKTTEEFYHQKRGAFIKEYEAINESAGRENVVIRPFQKAISQVGVPYIRLLLDGYNRGLVNASSLSESLGMKLKHLSKLEQAIFG